MSALLALVLLAQSGLAAGDKWSVERTYRFINEKEAVDLTNVERIDYRVDSVSASGLVLLASRRLTATRFGSDVVPTPAENPPKESKLSFGLAGAPVFEDDGQDRVRARVDRMQWVAAEERKGVSWTRKFLLTPAMPAAKVIVRPTSQKGDDQTVAISYSEEGSDIRGEGTAVVSGTKRIVTSLKLTLRNVRLPDGDVPVSAVVHQNVLK